jgi:outer membrane receptor protein involved in Fe transport
VFSSSFFLSGLASYVGGGFALAPQGGLDGPDAVLNADFTWENNFQNHETDRPQEQAKLDASYFFDTGSVGHELKFGAGYRTADLNSVSNWPGDALRLDYYKSFGYDYNVVQLTRPKIESLTTDYTSIYAQDTLTTGNLTANIGLRCGWRPGLRVEEHHPSPGTDLCPRFGA